MEHEGIYYFAFSGCIPQSKAYTKLRFIDDDRNCYGFALLRLHALAYNDECEQQALDILRFGLEHNEAVIDNIIAASPIGRCRSLSRNC